LLVTLAFAPVPRAAEINGVKIDDKITLQGGPDLVNGDGMRYKIAAVK